jgi:hypothetical protein
MPSALQNLHNWTKEAPQGLSRWPGAAVRITTGTRAGQIDFRKGRVIRVSETCIDVEADIPQPHNRLIKLMGDAYIHYCLGCQASIPGNVTYQRDADFRGFCPYCGPGSALQMVARGAWLRLHYRFQLKAQWANWYGEVWQW